MTATADTSVARAELVLDPADPFEAALIDMVATNRQKRNDYTVDPAAGPFWNFERTAAQTGLDPRQVVEVFIATKQARLQALTMSGREAGERGDRGHGAGQGCVCGDRSSDAPGRLTPVPAASSTGRVQSRTPAVHGGILNVSGAARLHIERRQPPTAPDHREADMTVATAPPGIVLEGFAGPGGWSTGLGMLPVQARTVGIEWDRAACKTAHAAGHTRVRADVARFDLTAFAGLVWLLIMSPPCQAWSRSGKRRGILDQAAIFAHAMRVTAAGEWIDYTDAGPLPMGVGDEGGTWHDARSPLVLEVLRWVLAVQPANICLEQVPDVLPFWELIARWLRGQGYSVWAGCLSSERYGVPQTRERAILIASRERAVSAPPATHTAYDSRLVDGGKWHGTDGDLFGGGLEPWASMAEALEWVPAAVVNTRGDRQTPGGNEFSADRPSWALTEKTRSWTVRQRNVRGAGMVERYGDRPDRSIDEPSFTITVGSAGSGPRLSWDLCPDGMVAGDQKKATARPIDHPAATVLASMDNGNQANAARRDLKEPAPTVMFAERSNKVEWESPEGESVRVTVQEAAVLQSFPPDYPWQGTKSAQFRQVGDAVPPVLAAHVIAACLGVQVESLEAAA